MKTVSPFLLYFLSYTSSSSYPSAPSLSFFLSLLPPPPPPVPSSSPPAPSPLSTCTSSSCHQFHSKSFSRHLTQGIECMSQHTWPNLTVNAAEWNYESKLLKTLFQSKYTLPLTLFLSLQLSFPICVSSFMNVFMPCTNFEMQTSSNCNFTMLNEN